MLDKLQEVVAKYEELGQLLSDPEVVADRNQFQKYAKAHASLAPVVAKYGEYQETVRRLEETRNMLKEPLDPELKDLAEAEIGELMARQDALDQELRVMLLPKDPRDEKNVILEIRAGAGGEEAALFAADLVRMYSKYAERMGWKVEMMSSSPTELGGLKEVTFTISGEMVYSKLKFESGVHRVQRVPATEASGRIHTSTVTVAVLPEAEEVDVEINPNDLKVDVYRSSGHGGQSVNTTDSAVRITHLPTGMVVTCQDERSQIKNREKALRILRARLLDQIEQEQRDKIAQDRRGQVGTGDRSERIRTYNFPQGRVTDHRVGITVYQLDRFLEGEMDEIISGLITQDQAEKLKNLDTAS